MIISVPIIIRNAVKLNYPLDRVVNSVVGLADEVVLLADPTSEDDTLDYVYDIALDVNSGTSTHGTRVEWYANAWDLSNIDNGLEFSVQTNVAIKHSVGEWILLLQADEAIHENDFTKIRSLVRTAHYKNVDAYSMTRLYFFQSMGVLRKDWTVPIIRLFKKGTRHSCGDAMNTEGSARVYDCDVPIYHYSRIGDPRLISRRILSLDRMFHQHDKLLSEDELPDYDFSTRNFDCMHRGDVNVGREVVDAQFVPFTGTHPKAFAGYTGFKEPV